MKRLLLLILILLHITWINASIGTFPDSLLEYSVKNYSKCHKMVERHTLDSIGKADSILFIPVLPLYKNVVLNWNYESVEQNKVYSSWEYLDYTSSTVDAFVLYGNNVAKQLYVNVGGRRDKQFIQYSRDCDRELLDAINREKPDGIFTICNVPGWFFIVDGDMLCYTLVNHHVFQEENTLDYLQRIFSDEIFIPVYARQLPKYCKWN